MLSYAPSGFNQSEIDSWDQHIWRKERDKIYHDVSVWCSQNQIDFLCGHGFAVGEFSDFTRLKKDKILYMQLFDMIPGISIWKDLSLYCQEHGKTIFVITDNQMRCQPLPCIYFFPIKEYLGVTASYGTHYLQNVEKKKLYNCFMQRVDSVRQSWLYFLDQMDLLDLGFVSFLLKQFRDYSQDLRGKELFDFIHKKYELDKLPNFDLSYHKLRDKVPFRNFAETNDLSELILQSKYSLVLETYATVDDCEFWCWTEKSLRDLQMPVLTLPFWQKNSAEILISLGFDLPKYMLEFDDDDWIVRQQKILKILKDDRIPFDYNECLDRCLRNRNLLNQWKNSYQKPDFLDPVFEKILSV